MNEDQVKEKYMQFKMIQEHIEQMSEHLQALNQQNEDIEISINALHEMTTTELNTDLLTPIADGIFISSKLTNNKTVIVNVGSNVTVEKTIPEAIKLLQKQQKETVTKVQEVEELVEQFNQQAMRIYNDVEKAQQKSEE
ncbi:TPA: prefoldin subunit alpha [Candidatus Woesearchaeota archaeon]|nr:prefoldin subunit alpha [Candidatus Woesearchaeota archaeon]